MTSTTGNPCFETGVDAEGTSTIECPLVKTQASGLLLSWPSAGDRRRAVLGKSPSIRKGNREAQVSYTRIVNVSNEDLEMHYRFTRTVPKGCTQPILDVELPFNPARLEVEHQVLLQHFQCAASRSLATFGHDSTELGNVLTRIALTSNSASSAAVLQSLLAFSALHRHNVYSQAVELKISAIKVLTAAVGRDIDTAEAVQHVAAGMLLCSFEIHRASCTSGEWTLYLRGVKNVIQAAGLDKLHEGSDLAVLLDWVYYHDVLARFSLRHWRGKSTGKPFTTSCVASSLSMPPNGPSIDPSALLSIRAEVSQAAPPALAVIELLSEVCDAVSIAMPSAEHVQDHTNFLKILDWRIRTMKVAGRPDDISDAPMIMELYQLAMRVYLSRATENLLNQGTSTQKQIDKGFTLLSRLGSCDRQFPVFILGCEARSDDQRAVILDLISRTEECSSSRSFDYVKILLQAIWAQDDLADGHVNYWERLSYVISCCRIVPTFV